MGERFFRILIIFSFVFIAFGSTAKADAGYTGIETTQPEPTCKKEQPQIIQQAECKETTQKLFSLGRSVGAAYYHLIDLCDKSKNKSFKELQKEYNDTFQNLNIIDIILNDAQIQGKSLEDLNKLRVHFYSALRNQDLSETHLAFVRDMFVVFYENLSQDVHAKYSYQGSWVLSLGFYNSFQLESLNSEREEKILLSGFNKILVTRSIAVPVSVYNHLLAIASLDKASITQGELIFLEQNLMSVTEYFTNYPQAQPIISELYDLMGVWQGVLINPDNEKYDIRLIIHDDLSAKMDIVGIAEDVVISDVRVINNYFTFMFKPFGTEKLYLRFNAKLSDELFAGEITDVLGEKGLWVLAKTDANFRLSEEKLSTMVSYIGQMEEKLKEASELAASQPEKTVETNNIAEEPADVVENREIPVNNEILSPQGLEEEPKEEVIKDLPTINEKDLTLKQPKKSNNIIVNIIKKLKNLVGRFFS